MAAYATPAQKSYIDSLLIRSGLSAHDARLPLPVSASLTTVGASVLIQFLKTLEPVAPKRVAVDAEGVYRRGNIIYRVKRSRQTGNLYAMTLNMDSTEKIFRYEKGAIYQISQSDRLTLAQAKDIGHSYGFCVVCGRLLTDERSVRQGIGPVCAKRV